MDREPASQPSERIERAFARLEAAADARVATAGVSALVHQNMLLRETIDETLGEIDQLIERLGG